MKKITNEELKEILKKHQKWLNKEDGGERANLYRADLTVANLTEANLTGANLYRANLTVANLYRADLTGANLTVANLYRADLTEANLYRANLTRAYLTGANLYRANLTEANLYRAYLYRADLTGANLTEANLYRADLTRADFADDILIAYTNVCPQEGSFIAFKKASGNIVKLLIPEDAKRSNATSNKCRCDKAEVLGIYDKEHNLLDVQEVKSDYDHNFIYKVGEIVQADKFDEDRWNECSNGIHFFLTFEMAVRY